jgi:RNA polymerase sigma-70 factor (ECF subfamily)
MTDKEFSIIIKNTKKTVLTAIQKNLPVRFYHAIDDVAQETYLRGYRGLIKGLFKNKSSIDTWLYTIAKNESHRMAKRLLLEEKKAIKLSQKISNKNPEILQQNDTSFDEIYKLMPEKYKRILDLKLQGFDEDYISAAIGISKGTVKSRFFRAKSMLKCKMETT